MPDKKFSKILSKHALKNYFTPRLRVARPNPARPLPLSSPSIPEKRPRQTNPWTQRRIYETKPWLATRMDDFNKTDAVCGQTRQHTQRQTKPCGPMATTKPVHGHVSWQTLRRNEPVPHRL